MKKHSFYLIGRVLMLFISILMLAFSLYTYNIINEENEMIFKRGDANEQFLYNFL